MVRFLKSYGLLSKVKEKISALSLPLVTMVIQLQIVFLNQTPSMNTLHPSTQEDISSLPSMEDSPFPQISSVNITVEGVASLLTNLKPHKAPGPDNIPASFLKETANEIAPILHIYKSSLDQGLLPVDWKSANISPIFKKGNRAQVCNYRPVSLTSICSKILEHIIII